MQFTRDTRRTESARAGSPDSHGLWHFTRILLALGLLFTAGLSQLPAQAAPPPPTHVTILNPPGAVYGTWAQAINGKGQVVGYYIDSDFVFHGYIYQKGAFIILEDPDADPTVGTLAQGINDRGQIVGTYGDSAFIGHGFIYENGVYTTVDAPGPMLNTWPYAINNRGEIVGWYDTADAEHGFVYSQGTFTTVDVPESNYTWLWAINDHGQIIGFNYAPVPGNTGPLRPYSFVYEKGIMTKLDLPGAPWNQALSINSRGQITGYYVEAGVGARAHGFIYDKGKLVVLDAPGAVYGTTPQAINEQGEVAGVFYDSTPVTHAFFYDKGVFTELPTPVSFYGSPGTITAINSQQEIIGYTPDREGNPVAFLVSR